MEARVNFTPGLRVCHGPEGPSGSYAPVWEGPRDLRCAGTQEPVKVAGMPKLYSDLGRVIEESHDL